MTVSGSALSPAEVYSTQDIASAAGVSVAHVERRVSGGRVPTFHGYVRQADAIQLLRSIVSGEPAESGDPVFHAVVATGERRGMFGLVVSGAVHALVALVVIASSLGLLNAASPEDDVDTTPARLVFLTTLGPGGGGGGGGLKIRLPPRRAERKAVIKRNVSSPVPEIRQPPPPPPVKVDPPPTPPPQPVVQAPVVPVPADRVDTVGVPTPAPPPPVTNQGAGAGGGAGNGAGTGLGEGAGPGIGAGSGGGEGGGPYQPGAGIDPPTLLREVKASYTDDARRGGIEGEVVLEIVVRRDGSVGDVRVRRGLHAGLNQRAIDAVRQWRFAPARRHGTAVDVVVEVAVEFKLR